MTTILRLAHQATVGVAISYVSIGLTSGATAEHLWAPYAGVTFLLALVNLRCEYARR